MDRRMIPHACFRLSNGQPTKKVRKELISEISYCFSGTSYTARIMSKWYIRRPSIHVTRGASSFIIFVDANRFTIGEWLVFIGPLDLPIFSTNRNAVALQNWGDDILGVCNCVHTFLTRTPEVDAIRWYFERGNYQSNAVASPTELPWGDSVDQNV